MTRDLGQSAAALGLILTGYGVGTVAGAVVMARIGHRRTVAPWFIGGNLLLAATLFVIAAVPAVPVLTLVALVAGMAQSLVLVTYLTMRTAYSPDALLSRIGSTARMISFGLLPVGLLIGGAIIDLTSGSTAIAIMGAGLAIVSLPFMASSALHRARSRPDPQEVAAARTDQA